MSMNNVESFLKEYLKERPLFLSLIRAKEADLYQKYLPFKHPVLDVGCGDGFFAKVTFGKLDVGLDLDDSRIKEARRLGIYKKFVTYDGKHIPFPDKSFSTVVSNCVLEHVEDLSSLLTEIHRVLKPGGLFLTTVMAKPWEDYLFGTKLFGGWYKKWIRKKQVHRNLLSKSAWDTMFGRRGFRIIEAKGYLSPTACALIDVCHYISLPSLISYVLFRKWVIFPKLTSMYPIKWFTSILSEDVEASKSGAVFYVLIKQ